MKLNLLYFALIAIILLYSCHPKIQKANIIQTKTESSIITKTKVDTLAKIENKLKAEDITLSISPKSFKNSSMGKAKIVITNNTKEHILAGQIYYIDFYEDNTWKILNINEGVIFDLVAYNINPFSSREFEVNLKIMPFNYKPGRYRIFKDGHYTSSKKRFLVSTEFIVE